MALPDVRVKPWVRACGVAAILAALPTVVWRAVVGVGLTLGTPTSWRRAEELPGSGTAYVMTLSVVQVAAALMTLLLIVRGADRVPRQSPIAAGRRLPASFIVGTSLTGAAVLGVLCILSAVNWGRVDPFRDAETVSAWSWLCWACYLVTPAWPLLLVATTLGYRRARTDQQVAIPEGAW